VLIHTDEVFISVWEINVGVEVGFGLNILHTLAHSIAFTKIIIQENGFKIFNFSSYSVNILSINTQIRAIIDQNPFDLHGIQQVFDTFAIVDVVLYPIFYWVKTGRYDG
jgi:hypothetical protein